MMQKVLYQERNILQSLTQGNEANRDNIQAVVDVAAHLAGGNQFSKRHIGRGDDRMSTVVQRLEPRR